MQCIEFDVLVILYCISCYFNYHVARFRFAFLWSHAMCSKHSFEAMCCPVNVYCDLDVPCIDYGNAYFQLCHFHLGLGL